MVLYQMYTAATLETLIRPIFAVSRVLHTSIPCISVFSGAVALVGGRDTLTVVACELFIRASTVAVVELKLLAVPVGEVQVGVVPRAVVAVAIAPSRAIVAVPVAVGVLAVAVVVRGLFPVVAGRRVRAPEDLDVLTALIIVDICTRIEVGRVGVHAANYVVAPVALIRAIVAVRLKRNRMAEVT